MSLQLAALTARYVELDFTRMAFDTRVSFSRSSTGTYFDAAGVMQTAASNVPRKEHNPATGAVRGLLVEEQRTNIALRSSELHDASWLAFQCSKVSNAAIAPDGTTTATKLISSSSAGSISSIGRSITYAAGTYTGTFDVKAGTTSYCAIRVNPPAGVAEVRFDLSSGAASVTSGAPVSYGAQQLSGGWWRCWASVNATAGAGSVYIYVYTTAGSRVWYTNSGEYIFATDAQLELGSNPSSYIPTTTAAVTRAADVASFTIPARVVRLVTIYDDGTTSQQTVTPGASYTIPTGQKPILRIRGYYA